MNEENLTSEPALGESPEPESTSEPKTRKYTRRAPKLDEEKIDAAPKRGRKAKTTGPVYDDEARHKLAKNLQGLHVMGAMILQFPELQIADHEADMLADGIIKVSHEYGLELSGKTGAAIQLFGAAAMIYLPRLAMLKKRRAEMPVTVDHAG